MLMDANDRTVDEDFLDIGIAGERGKDPLPHAAFLPPGKALIDAVPEAELLRQVAPGRSRPRHPQHGLDKPAIVPRATTTVAWFARQHVRNPLPLIVTQVQTSH
jgi:hypothetical protein